MRRWVLAFSAAAALANNGAALSQPALPPTVAATPDAQETAKLHALFDPHWQAVMRNAPDPPTYRGDLAWKSATRAWT